MKLKKYKKNGNGLNNRGFSLIELVVTVGIIVIISTLILVNYPNLSEMHSIDRAARLVSIKIRDAETRAMSIKEDPTSSTARFPAYGVHFDLSSPKNVMLFVDLNCSATATSNCKYESVSGDIIFETKIIPTNAVIKQICGNLKSDPFNKNCNLISADIVFLRPTPSVFLKGADNLGTYDFSDIEVIISEARTSDKKMIGATQGGQIFIEKY